MGTARVLSGVGAALRQWRQPPEFRIRESGWPADALAALTEFTRAAGTGTGTASAAAAGTAATGDPPDDPAAPPGPAAAPDPAAPGAAGGPGGQDGTGPAGTPDGDQGLDGRSVADVATSIWRMRKRMEGSADDYPRPVLRHLETAWDALADAGVEIRDHLHDPFDPGLSLTVVAFQPTPGLRREQVIETIRPGVYLGARPIQTAEVIVGTPEPPETPAPGAEEMGTR